MALTVPVQAKQEKNFFEQSGSEAKYVPGDFKPAPEKMKTRFGKLKFPVGYPTEKPVQKVYDELDLQRATQIYLDMDPAISGASAKVGLFRTQYLF